MVRLCLNALFSGLWPRRALVPFGHFVAALLAAFDKTVNGLSVVAALLAAFDKTVNGLSVVSALPRLFPFRIHMRPLNKVR